MAGYLGIAALAAGLALSVPPAAAAAEAGPRGETSVTTTKLAAEAAAARTGKFLFLHHSVGMNILAGIQAMDAGLPIVALEQPGALDRPGLVHVGGGRNTDPRSKIDAFAATIRGLGSARPDVAFMKLCYVDFEPRSDVDAILAHYRTTLEALKREFPAIRFAHVTTPLMRRPDDLKSSAKRLLGKEVWDDAANARRAEYNRKLRAAFPADPVLDLARVESTAPDGKEVVAEVAGERVPSLFPGYTEDGGHLNGEGQRVVATAALRFLADALARGRAAP